MGSPPLPPHLRDIKRVRQLPLATPSHQQPTSLPEPGGEKNDALTLGAQFKRVPKCSNFTAKSQMITMNASIHHEQTLLKVYIKQDR